MDLESLDVWLYPTFDPYEASEERYLNVAQLRQAGLDAARAADADYLLVSEACLMRTLVFSYSYMYVYYTTYIRTLVVFT